MVLAGFHRGERAVQEKLDYARAMEMFQGYTMVDDVLPLQHRIFHNKNLSFVPVTTLDASGRPWGSLLSQSGRPGFITSPNDTSLVITADIGEGDPIAENFKYTRDGTTLIAGLGIDFATRRRNKFAGKVSAVNTSGPSMVASLEINQALGNCPKYISIRALQPYPQAEPRVIYNRPHFQPGEQLPENVISFIHSSDTVFLGTSYVASKLDSVKYPSHLGMNHRGGRPGFVRVLGGRTCVIPDYSGNRLMQSLGNVDATPLASLTFFDFVTGDILYLTGRATNVIGEEAQSIMPRINVVTTVETTGFVYVANALAVRQKPGSAVERSPYSPPVRFLAEEIGSSEVALDDVRVTITHIKLHTPSVATFSFEASQPIAIKPGQHAIIDFSSFSAKEGYQHMAHEGYEASLNDDSMRTWTVSTAHPSLTRTFDLTIKEKKYGAVTGKLFHIAKLLTQKRPELVDDTTPLGINVGLVGIGGDFVLPAKPSKLLLVAGGIGITPFLSMLKAVSARDTSENWDITLIISTREPRLAAELVAAALGGESRSNICLELHIFSSTSVLSLDFPGTLHAGRPSLSFFHTIEDVQDRTIFVCGPPAFEGAVMEGLESAGADPATILRENFAY